MDFKQFVAVPVTCLACQIIEETLVDTLDGCIVVRPGDWIIKDSLGLRKVSDRVFKKCYVEIKEMEKL